MGLNRDVERLCLFFFPAPYLTSLRNVAGNFLTGKNIVEFADLFVGYNFDIDFFRQERLDYECTIVIHKQADLCRTFNPHFDVLGEHGSDSVQHFRR